jgi:hypothetical protein
MRVRIFAILIVLACVNMLVFAVSYSLAALDTGASFTGLVPAIISFASLFASSLLGGIGVNEILKEIRQKRVSWQALFATLLATAPLLFFLFADVIPHRLKNRHPEQPNKSLQATAAAPVS